MGARMCGASADVCGQILETLPMVEGSKVSLPFRGGGPISSLRGGIAVSLSLSLSLFLPVEGRTEGGRGAMNFYHAACCIPSLGILPGASAQTEPALQTASVGLV